MKWAISFLAFIFVGCALASDVVNTSKAPNVYFGMHIHRADQGTAWPKVGIGSWRLWDAYVAWPNLQPNRDRWDFDRLDRYVAMAQLTKVEILLPLGLSPQWASARPHERSSYGLGNAAEPRDIQDWRNYVRTVATRYKGKISRFEIWNEPNEHGFYTGTTEKLLELTCEAYRVLKSVSKDNLLVSPALVGLAKAPEQLGEFLNKGGKHCIDIVGFHFYLSKGPPETVLPLIQRVRTAMAKADVTYMPLWNTESGWWIENDDGTQGADQPWQKRISTSESAAWVARSLLLGRAMKLDRYFWYAWDSKSLGLIEPTTGSLKPGAHAFRTVARWLDDGDISNCREYSGRWSCQQSDGNGKTFAYVVWASATDAPAFRLRKEEVLQATEFLDGSRKEAPGEKLVSEFDVGLEPKRLVLKR